MRHSRKISLLADGIRPDKKTIFSAVADLKALGYDIKNQRGGGNSGYYLGNRDLSLSDLTLISDAVEGLMIPADAKIALYEKLQGVTGVPTAKFDPAFYEEDNIYTELMNGKDSEEYNERLSEISQAINTRHTLSVHTLNYPQAYFLTEPSDKAREELLGRYLYFLYHICPLKLFHNAENEMYLFFSVTVLDETYFGAIDITEPISIFAVEEEFEPPKNYLEVLSELDPATFVKALYYRDAHQILSSSFHVYESCSFLYIDEIQRRCITFEREDLGYGLSNVKISFYKKHLDDLVHMIIEMGAGVVFETKGSEEEDQLLDKVIYIYNQLQGALRRCDTSERKTGESYSQYLNGLLKKKLLSELCGKETSDE